MNANLAVVGQPTHIQRGALKLKEAAEYLGGFSTITVRRLVKRGVLRANRATRHITIPISELNRFLNQ